MSAKRGFTILELLIVISIIGILAAMALPRFQDATNQARCASEKGNKRQIDTQIELYNITTAFFPENPNMQSLLQSTSYFPDGLPKDPFLNTQALGDYTLDMSGSPPVLRTITHATSNTHARSINCL